MLAGAGAGAASRVGVEDRVVASRRGVVGVVDDIDRVGEQEREAQEDDDEDERPELVAQLTIAERAGLCLAAAVRIASHIAAAAKRRRRVAHRHRRRIT